MPNDTPPREPLKRYAFDPQVLPNGATLYARESRTGKWVKYEDHLAALAEREAEIERQDMRLAAAERSVALAEAAGRGYLERAEQAERKLDEARGLLRWFVYRCERGEVLSKETYRRFREHLDAEVEKGE